MTQTGKHRVFIVDDHPIVCQGIASLINCEEDFAVCGCADNALEALRSIANISPDVAIVDLGLKDSDGLKLIRELKEKCPGVIVMVLSMHDESLYAERAVKAGARGYVMKEEATDRLLTALRTVINGDFYLSENVSHILIEGLAGKKGTSPENLSDREMEVLLLTGGGTSKSEIADSLGLSIKTVDTYREKIKQKLNLPDSRELLKFAIKYAQSFKK